MLKRLHLGIAPLGGVIKLQTGTCFLPSATVSSSDPPRMDWAVYSYVGSKWLVEVANPNSPAAMIKKRFS